MPYKDPEKEKAYHRNYSRSSVKRAADAKYREAHREEARLRAKLWRAANPERSLATVKAWRKAHPKEAESFSKAWKLRNPDRVRMVGRERAAAYRAIKHTAEAEKVNLQQILLAANGLCGICKKPFDLFGIHFDHIIPLSRGGTHTTENIQATHAHCNHVKSDKVG